MKVSFIQFFCVLWLIGVLIFSILNREEWIRYEFDGNVFIEGEVVSVLGWSGGEQRVRVADDSYEGVVEVRTKGFPRLRVGDLVEIDCIARGIDEVYSNEFRYDLYLAKEGVFVLCNGYSEPLVVGRSSGLLARVFDVRDIFAGVMNRHLPEPSSSLLAGLLYGARSSLPDRVLEDFRRTGTMHIVAVSGYNVMVVANIILLVLTSLFLKRQHAFYFVIAGIVLYIVLTGADPGVLRAGIMGGLVLVAKQVGRFRSGVTLFLLAGVFMTAYNPRMLLDDVGFQLSFSAAIGLVYLSPVFRRFVGFLPERFGIASAFTETVSAIIATMPVMLFQFRQFSLVAPIANLFIVPLIPAAMFMGFFGTLIAIVSEFFGMDGFATFVMMPAYVFLRLILWLVALFSPLPFINFS